MRKTTLVTISLISIFTGLFIANSASAQAIIPLGNGVDCATFPNGNQYLSKNGELIDSKPVLKKLATQRAALNRAIQNLNELNQEFVSPEPDNIVLGQVRKLFKKFLGSGEIPKFDTISKRKAAVDVLRAKFRAGKAEVNTYIDRIRDCDSGKIKVPSNVAFVYPSAKLVSFRGINEAYAGFMLVTKARKNKFSTKPTGFTGCLKIYWTDGSISGLYTGMGDEPCYGQAGIFEQATNACNATLAKGQVGYPLQKAQGIDLSDEGLQNLEDIVATNLPLSVFMVMTDLSRDKAISLCDQFLNS